MRYTYHTMLMPRLLFPEPGDTGGGDTATNDAPAENAEVNEIPMETPQEEGNVFEDLFTNADDGEGDADEEQTDDTYALELTKEDGFDDEDIPMLTSLCRKHNLPAAGASAFLKDMYAEVERQGKANEQRAFNEGTKALRDKWGASFDSNSRKAGSMIRQLGGRLNWSPEQMKAMLNPRDVELMYELSRAFGDTRTHGLHNTAIPQREPEMTKAQIDARRQELVNEHLIARTRGDLAAMKKASDEHYELSKKVAGPHAMRILRDK